MALILPTRRVVQPDGPASIDWSNPIAAGLTQAYRHDFGLYAHDAVSGAVVALSEATGMAKSVSVVGKGISRTGSSTSLNQGHLTLPVTVPAGGDCTYLVVHSPNAATGSQALIDDDNASGSRIFQFRLNAAATDFIWFNTSGTAFTASLASSVSARALNASIAVKRGNTLKVVNNGRISSATTITGTPRTQNSVLREFNRKGSTYSPYQGSHSLAVMWSRALSDAELIALSQNPWQLFKPVERRILVPLDAGGGTPYSLTADVGSYTLTGQDAAFTYAPGAASYTLTADAGSYSLTGQDAGLSYAPGSGAYLLTAEFGTYNLTGVDAAVSAGRNMSAEFGAYTLTGLDAGVSVGRRVAGEFGSYSLTGQDATLTAVGAASYSLTAEVGLYSVDGQSATLTGPETKPEIDLLGGGPGLPKKRKQIEKGSYLERLLSPPLVDRLERIKPEAAEVIEEIAEEVVQQQEPVTVAVQALRRDLKAEGIAYREAYQEVLKQLVSEMRQAQEEEDEELTAVLAAVF